jgi:hypothetical protein
MMASERVLARESAEEEGASGRLLGGSSVMGRKDGVLTERWYQTETLPGPMERVRESLEPVQ